ncbi:DNA replication licensing factor mcm-5-like [Schistocerca gregaria]|uniref:DNA replication licensing factor mcm-5-like n=1 Tax=Schistocerca gregaria TaxID=7010 RepID=UPI00211EB341|nr:DNA replication licensing factor mcm-5-like [Schistocerca gregaria]
MHDLLDEELPIDQVHDIQAILVGNMTPVSLRQLSSANISKLVCVSGIVVSSSRIQAKASLIRAQCRYCGDVQTLPVPTGFGHVELPRTCKASDSKGPDEAKCPATPYVIQPEMTKYIDLQILKLQETPEKIPSGEMPRHAQLVAERALVGRVVPGMRVVLVGVSSLYMSYRNDQGVKETSVRYPYIKVLGFTVDAEGVGRTSNRFTEEEVTEFKAMAKRPDIYPFIVSKIAPVIYGHDDIKRALACQMFGGCRKIFPDGMKLRGDINILLLGDPGTAKSQLLKFVERAAPIGVYTSGKGSSAAGLTASVIRDPKSREFYLEGGAMVLADGGIVCIDEFDKMRQQDRVAIHEAMEQQTISIAKAGITTVLNARSATLATKPATSNYLNTS